MSRRGPARGAALPLALSGRGVTLTPTLKSLIESKLARLGRATRRRRRAESLGLDEPVA